MKLILKGRSRPSNCSCMFVNDNPDNPDENTGISVHRSCSVHGHMLQGYMWHPALGCECVITRYTSGWVATDMSECPTHRSDEYVPIIGPTLNFPVTKTVMK